jgi:hypothetical protein
LAFQAIDDAGHDKASILKVKALEAVDRTIGQLAKLLLQAESTGKFQYFICVTLRRLNMETIVLNQFRFRCAG